MKQIMSTLGSVVVGACCLGIAPILAALTAMGAGFLINDAILIPLLLVFLDLSIWSLSASRNRHGENGPLYLGIGCSVMAFMGLWIFAPISYLGFAGLMGASVWDFVTARREPSSGEI